MEKIETVNKLVNQIKELHYFLITTEPLWNVQRGSGSYDINSLIKVKTVKTFSIFASRWFGCGTHKSEIEVPNTLIESLHSNAKALKDKLEKQLNDLVPNYDSKIIP